jgi:DNA-binding response OmpR family regulator
MAPSETRAIAVKVLSVGSHPEDHIALGQLLAGHEPPFCRNCRFEVAVAHDVDGALEVLENDGIPIVLCERELGKDSWRTLLARLERLENPPFLIVGSRSADEFLWAEALNLGAYDVLVKPFRASEVVRTLGLAWLRWSRAERPRRVSVA